MWESFFPFCGSNYRQSALETFIYSSIQLGQEGFWKMNGSGLSLPVLPDGVEGVIGTKIDFIIILILYIL